MQKLTTHLWFDKDAKGAADFYVSIFPNSKITSFSIINDTPSGTVDTVSFELNGAPFQAIGAGPMFKFTEAISIIIPCDDQKEIDYYWEKLSADPKAEQCGWLKDKYGLSWQVIPTALGKFMNDKDAEKRTRVTQAFLKMKKFDIAGLQAAYDGK